MRILSILFKKATEAIELVEFCVIMAFIKTIPALIIEKTPPVVVEVEFSKIQFVIVMLL
jgi:hypothetical protein